MNRKFPFLFTEILFIAFLASSLLSVAQIQTREDISEGREFWFGLPLCGREQNEAIRGDYPIAIWISSKVDTRATISDAETGTMVNVVVRKNQITQVPYGDFIMNKISEVPGNYAIRVTSDDPVSVSVYMSYRWTGEAFRVIPVEWLGRKYITVNMYQDQLLSNSEYRPPQILVIATDDNTKVTYRPTTETEKGIKPGSIGSVNLMKWQTFLILGSIKPGKSQDASTDLTGTYIESNKPIAVISGHTKAAFPRYQFTFLGRNGGFMRNMMAEMVLPFELLGTEYVSAPLAYADRPRGKITDDKGDLIRFVATEDNTFISQYKFETGLKQISPVLKRGQYYDIVNQEDAAYYQSNNKVLAAQYGKQWWIYPTSPQTKASDDQPQNPSRNGQGMLITLSPLNHWTSYAAWRLPAEIDDYIYMTFDKKYLNYLYIDGQKFIVKYGNSVKYLEGTNYAYITESISAGDHYIYGDSIPGTNNKERAKFAVYAYGNWDRSKDGFAYGYPAGVKYNYFFNDSLVVKDTMICGDIIGSAEVLPANSDSSFIYNVLDDSLNNYDFKTDPNFKPGDSKKVTYYFNIVDHKRYAFGKIKVQTKSGLTETRTYEYLPEEIKYVPDVVDFGQMLLGDSVCSKIFDIVNYSTKAPVTVKRLYLRDSKPEFKINETSTNYPLTLPFTLKPGEKRTVEVCAIAPVYTMFVVRDYVIAELSCYEWPQAELKYRMGEPVVWIDDAIWQNIHVGNIDSQQVKIINKSNVEATLTKITWPDADKTSFPKVEGLPCGPQGGAFTAPLRLQPNEEFLFTTYFQPQDTGSYQTQALFEGNATKDKLYSDWKGTAYTDIENELNENVEIECFNGLLILSNISYADFSLNIFDILGRKVAFNLTGAQVGDEIQYDISFLQPGLYIAAFVQGKSLITKQILK